MSTFLSRLNSPTVLLYLFVLLTQIAAGGYQASGLEPPASYTFIYTCGFLWVVGWWLRTDSRKRGIGWVFDMGLFLYVAWPFVLPYYLFKSRGVRAVLVILGFAAVYIGGALLGMALYLLLAPSHWPTAV